MTRLDSVTFTVPWVRGKARPRFTRRGGTYTDGRTERAMDEIAWRFREVLAQGGHGGEVPTFGGDPVQVSIHVHCELPKSRPKRVESEEYCFTPDVDNVAKLVLDALNGVAWVDDRQVVGLTVLKLPRVRGSGTHTDVRVSRVKR